MRIALGSPLVTGLRAYPVSLRYVTYPIRLWFAAALLLIHWCRSHRK